MNNFLFFSLFTLLYIPFPAQIRHVSLTYILKKRIGYTGIGCGVDARGKPRKRLLLVCRGGCTWIRRHRTEKGEAIALKIFFFLTVVSKSPSRERLFSLFISWFQSKREFMSEVGAEQQWNRDVAEITALSIDLEDEDDAVC